MGGTMRLGARTTFLREGSLGAHIYGATTISERHRHRYEVNPALVPRLEEGDALLAVSAYNKACPKLRLEGGQGHGMKRRPQGQPQEILQLLAGEVRSI